MPNADMNPKWKRSACFAENGTREDVGCVMPAMCYQVLLKDNMLLCVSEVMRTIIQRRTPPFMHGKSSLRIGHLVTVQCQASLQASEVYIRTL